MMWSYGPEKFDVEGGVPTVLEFKVPWRGTILAMTISQVDGASDGTLQLFDTINSVADMLPEDDPRRLTGRKGAEGFAQHTFSKPIPIVGGLYHASDMRTAYRNRDSTTAQPVYKLWGVLNIAGTGQQRVAISMTIEPVRHK